MLLKLYVEVFVSSCWTGREGKADPIVAEITSLSSETWVEKAP